MGGVLLGLPFLIPFIGCDGEEQREITAFVGSASKPAMEEAARAFEEETGIKVYLNFGGSGTVLAQMKLSQSGDLYLPGSPDYMAIAEQEGVVEPDSVEILAYLVPAILVQHGNPGNIQTLSDFAGLDIKVGLGNPEAVCVGLYAIEILEYSNLMNEVGNNIITYTESCSKTASLIALKSADAIIGWRVFSKWNPETTDVVYLEPEQIPRIAYIPGAVSTYSEDRESAKRFLDFLVSPEGQQIFNTWGYIASEVEARQFAPDAQIGGEYRLPASYRPLVK